MYEVPHCSTVFCALPIVQFRAGVYLRTFFVALEIEPTTLGKVGKYSSAEVYPLQAVSDCLCCESERQYLSQDDIVGKQWI